MRNQLVAITENEWHFRALRNFYTHLHNMLYELAAVRAIQRQFPFDVVVDDDDERKHTNNNTHQTKLIIVTNVHTQYKHEQLHCQLHINLMEKSHVLRFSKHE